MNTLSAPNWDHPDPVKNFYLLGFADARDPQRKRKRAVTRNFQLAYYGGWFDAKMNRPQRYHY
jgi:hypothetical protein